MRTIGMGAARVLWWLTLGGGCLGACQATQRAAPSGRGPETDVLVATSPPSPPSPPSPSDTVLVSTPRPHSWQLAGDSPFFLVGKGLRDGFIHQLDQTVLISSDPCGVPSAVSRNITPKADPTRPAAPYWSTIRAVEGDAFAAHPLPPSPKQEGRWVTSARLEGHAPNDIWLQYSYAHNEPGPSRRFLHFTGQRWASAPVDPADGEALEPSRLFDWFDGSKLVAQGWAQKFSSHLGVAPFLVWGDTSHRPPDFTTLHFPTEGKDNEVSSVSYAVLPTGEAFVAHLLYLKGSDETLFNVGRSVLSGDVSIEPILRARGAWSTPTFASGKLAGKDTLALWSARSMQGGKTATWVRLYDRTSSVEIPAPGPKLTEGELQTLWFAGGDLWALRDGKVWRYDGRAWSVVTQASRSTQLSPLSQDGSLWALENFKVWRVDREGKRTQVPLFEEPNNEIFPVQVVAVSPGDTWLAAGDSKSTYLFRTRKMNAVLSCE